jgi:tRNA nucleotidyltransferase (CCA-adding enzyme)
MARSTQERLRRRISLYFDRLQRVRTRITGEDLAALGVPQGKLYGSILGQVLAAKLDGEVSSKEEELNLAKRLWDEHQGA